MAVVHRPERSDGARRRIGIEVTHPTVSPQSDPCLAHCVNDVRHSIEDDGYVRARSPGAHAFLGIVPPDGRAPAVRREHVCEEEPPPEHFSMSVSDQSRW